MSRKQPLIEGCFHGQRVVGLNEANAAIAQDKAEYERVCKERDAVYHPQDLLLAERDALRAEVERLKVATGMDIVEEQFEILRGRVATFEALLREAVGVAEFYADKKLWQIGCGCCVYDHENRQRLSEDCGNKASDLLPKLKEAVGEKK